MTKTSLCTYGLNQQEQPYMCRIDYLTVLLDSRLLRNVYKKETWSDPSQDIWLSSICAYSEREENQVGPSKKKGIFVGYCEVSKAFRIYISGLHHIEISRDVTFDEETTLKKSRRCQLEEVHEEDVPPRKVEAGPSPEMVASEYHDMLEPQEHPTMDIS